MTRVDPSRPSRDRTDLPRAREPDLHSRDGGHLAARAARRDGRARRARAVALDPQALGHARAAAQSTRRDTDDADRVVHVRAGAGANLRIRDRGRLQAPRAADRPEPAVRRRGVPRQRRDPSSLPRAVRRSSGSTARSDASVAHVTENFHVLAGAGDPVKAEMREDALEWILRRRAALRRDLRRRRLASIRCRWSRWIAATRSRSCCSPRCRSSRPPAAGDPRVARLLDRPDAADREPRDARERPHPHGARGSARPARGLHDSRRCRHRARSAQPDPVSRVARGTGSSVRCGVCEATRRGEVRAGHGATHSEPLMSRLFGRHGVRAGYAKLVEGEVRAGTARRTANR